ncbi:MAG: ABC transporter ATP-binding protein [Bacilli bacterium]
MSENVLEVKDLSKKYPSFQLSDVSFSLKKGEIMGFVGRNGAGKTTTIKSMFNIVHPDSGMVLFNGTPFLDHELINKQKLSILLGGVDYYPKTRIKTLTQVTKRFYQNWDGPKYENLLKRFALDENKRITELSAGMKVKYGLAIALSHHAELLVLDEPTSGLDPISRDELLNIFENLVDEENVAILFSTHITSDLEKCADTITYIQKGKLLASKSLKDFKQDYLFIKGPVTEVFEKIKNKAISYHLRHNEAEALFKKENYPQNSDYQAYIPDIDTIMVYLEKESGNEEPLI